MFEPSAAAEQDSRRTRIRALVDAARRQASDTSVRPHSVPGSNSFPTTAIPGYVLENEIHRGGQGIVYSARQSSTGRTVAVKIMREGPFSGSRDRARFEREVQVLAQLQHPNIVGVLDSGTAAGSAYFIMDHVVGLPLDQWVTGLGTEHIDGPAFAGRVTRRGIERIIELFVKVCEAVHAAHLRGIIHRDLKPNNILVDAGGDPHVLDFGLAKVRWPEGEVGEGPSVTATGQFMGSLPWASPEQAAGDSGLIDIRTDVYSIGVMLYHSFTGRFPYSVVGSIRDVLGRIAADPPMRPSAVCRGLDDELDTIVLKCLAKERERRYESAGELARDLRHYLANEPIEAKRDSAWYVLRKSLRRYRVPVAVAATMAFLVTASAISLSILYGRQGVLLSEVKQERDKAVTAEHVADLARKKAEYESYRANIAAADGAVIANDGGAARQRLNDATPALRNWEWRFLSRAADASFKTQRGLEGRHLRHVGFSPDGRYLAGLSHRAGIASQLDVWDWESGASILRLQIAKDDILPFHVKPYGFSSDSLGISVCAGDGHVAQYELPSGREIRRVPIARMPPNSWLLLAEPPIFACYWILAPDRWVVRFWSEEDDALQGEFEIDSNWFNASACAPDRRRIALGMADGTIYLWTVAANASPQRLKLGNTLIHGLTFSPDGRELATSTEDGQIRVWRLHQEGAEPQLLHTLRVSAQRVGSVAFSPDGSRLAAASADKTLRVWDLADGALLHTLRGHSGPLCAVAFHPDAARLVTGGYDSTGRFWDLARPTEVLARRDMSGMVNTIEFCSDETRLMVATPFGILDGTSLRTIVEFPGAEFAPFVFSHGGENRALLRYREGTVQTIALPSGRETNRFAEDNLNYSRIFVDPPGNRLVMLKRNGAGDVTIRKASDGATIQTLRLRDDPAQAVSFSPDGARLVCGLRSGAICSWEVLTGYRQWTTRHHQSHIMSIAFSRDGDRLATASDDGAVNVHDARTGDLQLTMRPQIGDVWCVAFSPDGTRLAAGGRDRTVRIFDAATGFEMLSLRGPTGTILDLCWSPDGRRIAAGSWAHEVFLWDAGPSAEVAGMPDLP